MFRLTVLLLFLPVIEALKLMVIPGEKFLKKGNCFVRNKLVKFTRQYKKPNQRS